MIELVTSFCFIILALSALMAIWRLLAGPSILDRVISFDMVAICIVGMIILISVRAGHPLFIEIMLIFSLLGFVGTIAFVSFLHTNPGRFQGTEEKQDHHHHQEPK